MNPEHKPLLCVLSHSRANEAVIRHLPWWLKGEADIFWVGRKDTKCEFPEVPAPRLAIRKDFGKEEYGVSNLYRFNAVLKFYLDFLANAYTSICITEWDTLIFKPIPKPPMCVLVTNRSGFHHPEKDDRFHGTMFFHPPWLMDNDMALLLYHYSNRLLKANLTEQGFLDRWIGLMVDLFSLPWESMGTHSRDSLDTPEFMAMAREAVKAGVWHIHGVKSRQQLEELTE